ncbi:hypothetical protein Tco_0715730 [Tanacetum coccineum]
MSKADDLPFMFSYSFLELLNADTFDVDVVMGSGVTHDNLQEVVSSDCMIIHGTKTPPLGSNGVEPQVGEEQKRGAQIIHSDLEQGRSYGLLQTRGVEIEHAGSQQHG